MLIELALAAAMSGSPEDCPKNAPRLHAIAAALERRPQDATLYYWEAATWADCGRTSAALAALDRAHQYGEGFLPIRPIGFAQIWDDPEFQKRYHALERALPQVGTEVAPAFKVRGAQLIPEGVAYDASNGALYVGSIAQSSIVRVDRTGQSVLADRAQGLDGVLGLALDAGARKLYAVSTNQIFPIQGEAPRNRVLVFDLKMNAIERTLPAPDAGQLNDVTYGPDGAVYATDSRGGSVYVARAGDKEMSLLFDAGSLAGANGLAMSADGKSLIVAHATGIARFELAAKAFAPIVNTTRETIAAIDGLYFHRGKLIGVQNATNPGRVIEITLTEDGAKVASVKTLLSHHHRLLDEPTTGAVDGDRFLLLANSYIGALDDSGKLRPEIKPKDPVILEIKLQPE